MKLAITLIVIIVISCAVIVFFQQSRDISGQKILRFNQTVATAIEDHLQVIMKNPVCQYSDANPPAIDSVPDCNWRMKWIMNGTEQILNTARSETLYYDGTHPLYPNYIRQHLDNYFQLHGFKSNQENTRVENLSSTGEQKTYVYAYENDQLRCSLTIPELLVNGRSSYAPPIVFLACIKGINQNR